MKHLFGEGDEQVEIDDDDPTLDCVLAWILKDGFPRTQAKYAELAYLGQPPPDGWQEAIPSVVQDWPEY